MIDFIKKVKKICEENKKVAMFIDIGKRANLVTINRKIPLLRSVGTDIFGIT